MRSGGGCHVRILAMSWRYFTRGEGSLEEQPVLT